MKQVERGAAEGVRGPSPRTSRAPARRSVAAVAPGRAPRLLRRRVSAALAALLVLGPWPATALAESEPLREVPLRLLASGTRSNAPVLASERGVEVEVEGPVALVFPLQGAQELEIDYQASGILLVTYITVDPSAHALPDHRGPPYRYEKVRSGRGQLKLSLLQTAHWTPRQFPYLLLEGAGHFTITRLRFVPPPPDEASARTALDWAVFLSPLALGYTTINLLYVPWWSISDRTFLYERLGWSFVGLSGLLALGFVLLRRGFRPLQSVAIAALVVTVASNAVFLAKFLPMANLALRFDPEARIRENYSYAPKLGALAALARRTLRADDRVGVRGRARDWFAAEVLCFNLAPRRCVTVVPGDREYVGMSQVDRLRPEELDAIVSIDIDDPLPPGFARVAEVSANAFVARRQ